MLRRIGATLRYSTAKKLINSSNQLSLCRAFSAWIDSVKSNLIESTSEENLDVERVFTDHDVQKLLAELTGLDLSGKIFAPRRTARQERSHYALMTDHMYEETMERMKDEGKHFLQFVPFKEPRSETFTVLAEDKEIADFDESKFVFTDVTFDATDQDRTVVVREPDGVLRTALPEEHDRMNRIYYEQPNRPVFEPPLFSYPHLQNALDRDEHEFVLDWACYFYEPDDPAFVKLCRTVFDRTVKEQKFSLLYSTRHFGSLVFYMVLNGNIPPLLNHFGAQGSITDAAKLIRLHKIVHRDWRVAISSEDDDRKIVMDYIKQNLRYKAQLKDLIALLQSHNKTHSTQANGPSSGGAPKRSPDRASTERRSLKERVDLMDEKTIRSETGPLGELAKTYTVRVARSSYEEGQKEGEGTKGGAEGGSEPKKTIQKRTRSKGRKRRSNVNDETDDRSKT